MDATVAVAVVKLRLDISTGDPVAPPPTIVDYPTLLGGHPRLRVLGYPLPVVLAEKLCTAVELGAGNSRVRDYAGIWTLARSHDITAADLLTALAATSKHRDVTLRPLAEVIGDYGVVRAGAYRLPAPPRTRRCQTPRGLHAGRRRRHHLRRPGTGV